MKTKGCGEVAPFGGVGWAVLNALLPALSAAALIELCRWGSQVLQRSEASPWMVAVMFRTLPAESTAMAPGLLYVVPCWTVMLAGPLRTTLGPRVGVGLGACVVTGAAAAEAADGQCNTVYAKEPNWFEFCTLDRVRVLC